MTTSVKGVIIFLTQKKKKKQKDIYVGVPIETENQRELPKDLDTNNVQRPNACNSDTNSCQNELSSDN